MAETVIETKGLTKRYGDFTAVNALNLSLSKGEVYGLLGPNGSGKTTTILMLLGLTEPTKGQVRVLGFDPVRQPLSVKSHVGYLPDSVGFYDNLTARENLIYIAKLNGLPREEAYQRIDEALLRIGLQEAARQRVGTFSRGMRQRLGLAELLLKQPEIIIMDEPTLGLDPEAARRFLQMIRELKEEGITILLSSHLLQQVQSVCDRVGLFHRGQIVLEGSVTDLALKVLGGAYHITLGVETASPGIETGLRKLPGVKRVQLTTPTQYLVETERDVRAEAAQTVVNTGGRLMELDVARPSLDDIYSKYFSQEVNYVPAA